MPPLPEPPSQPEPPSHPEPDRPEPDRPDLQPAPPDQGATWNPAGVIYGVLTIATVIAAESTRRETYGKLLAASAVTLALYWLAHAYSHHWGSRLRSSAAWTTGEVMRSLTEESSILAGAALPVAVLGAAWAAGAAIETGVTAVLWCAGVEVGVLEVVTGLRRRLGARDMVVQSLIGAALGLGILAVRVLLH